jgi:hypothetical protein
VAIKALLDSSALLDRDKVESMLKDAHLMPEEKESAPAAQPAH